MCYFLQVYEHISKSINVFLHYHFVAQCTNVPILLNLTSFTLSDYQLITFIVHWVGNNINVYLDIEIILPFPTLPPSAHHDTKTVSVNLFGPVSQIFFSVCNAPIYNHTHKGILMLLYIILQNTIIFYITLNNLCFA